MLFSRTEPSLWAARVFTCTPVVHCATAFTALKSVRCARSAKYLDVNVSVVVSTGLQLVQPLASNLSWKHRVQSPGPKTVRIQMSPRAGAVDLAETY